MQLVLYTGLRFPKQWVIEWASDFGCKAKSLQKVVWVLCEQSVQ